MGRDVTTALTKRTRLELFLLLVLAFVLTGSISLALGLGVAELLSNDIESASNYAGFVSGIATVILVLVTGWYTYETRRLVEQQQKERLDEWFESIVVPVRLMIEAWHEAFSEPDGSKENGEAYIELNDDNKFYNVFDREVDRLMNEISRYPSDTNRKILEVGRDIHRLWIQTQRSSNPKLLESHPLRLKLTQLESKIYAESDRFGREIDVEPLEGYEYIVEIDGEPRLSSGFTVRQVKQLIDSGRSREEVAERFGTETSIGEINEALSFYYSNSDFMKDLEQEVEEIREQYRPAEGE